MRNCACPGNMEIKEEKNMHELGIVFHIAKKVESLAVENHVNHVAKVVLEIGEVSTVIPSYLEDCWKWKCTKSEILKDCQLEVEMIPAVTFCEDCEENADAEAESEALEEIAHEDNGAMPIADETVAE